MRKKIYFLTSLLFLFVLSTYGQVTIYESFEGVPTDGDPTNGPSGTPTMPAGWTLNAPGVYDDISDTDACHENQILKINLYGSSSTSTNASKAVVSPAQVSNGNDINVYFEWSTLKWTSGQRVALAAVVSYSIDNGATYQFLGNYSSNTRVDCAVFSEVIPGASVPSGSNFRLKVEGYIDGSGYIDFDHMLDNFQIVQVGDTAPNCDAVVSTALVAPSGLLTWDHATGGPLGYTINIGTTSGGNDVVDDGNTSTNSFQLPNLDFSTTYYVEIIPFNDSGDATACTEQTFTTIAAPTATNVTCGNTRSYSYCYGSNANQQLLYESSDGSELNINFTSGNFQNTGTIHDYMIVYDGPTTDAPILYESGYDATVAGVSLNSTSPYILIVVRSDADGTNCTSSSFISSLNYELSCLGCQPAVIENIRLNTSTCPATLYFDVVDMGSATELAVTNNTGGTINPANITAVGQDYAIEGVLGVGNFEFSVTNVGQSECVTTYGPIGYTCPIPNDNCLNAEDVTDKINTGSFDAANNNNATDGANPFYVLGETENTADIFHSWSGGDSICFKDAWFKVTPQLGNDALFGFMSVSTKGTSFNTRVAVYKDCGNLRENVISGNDDYDGNASYTTWAVEDGVTYYIQVGGAFPSDIGTIKLDIKKVDITDVLRQGDGLNKVTPFNVLHECDDKDGWTHYVKVNEASPSTPGKLLLSAKRNGNFYGWTGPYINFFGAPTTGRLAGLEVFAGSGALDLGVAATGTCASTPAFYASTEHWITMNRTWDIKPTTNNFSMTSNVDIRFYFTQADYEDVYDGMGDAGIPPLAGVDNLVFYKLHDADENLTDNPCHADDNETPNAAIVGQYNEYYASGTSPTAMVSPYGTNAFYGQFSIGEFSGGGGGGGNGEDGGALGTVLPFDLLFFRGKAFDDYNELYWSSQREVNTHSVEIERLELDGRTWAKVGLVEALNYSNELVRYNFVDEEPFKETYYRLKMIDNNGDFSYSKVVRLVQEEDKKDLAVYPNPFTETFKIHIGSQMGNDVTVKLYDVSGKLMTSKVYSNVEEGSELTLSTEGLFSGMYLLEVNDGVNVFNKRITKK